MAAILPTTFLKGIFFNKNDCICIKILLRFIPEDLADNDTSSLVQVIVWCFGAPSHYLNQKGMVSGH